MELLQRPKSTDKGDCCSAPKVLSVMFRPGVQHPCADLMIKRTSLQHSPILNYWLVTISSKDRNKLFFDTVCTFADLNYDVYHSTIDRQASQGNQRNRAGSDGAGGLESLPRAQPADDT